MSAIQPCPHCGQEKKCDAPHGASPSGSLSIDTVIPYLIERGLLDKAAVVDGDVMATDVSRRNRNFKVSRRNGQGYLIKKSEGSTPHTRESLRREAKFYEQAQTDARIAELRRYLPRLFDFREEESLLVVELFEDALPLWQFASMQTPDHFPIEPWTALGEALAILHRMFRFSPEQRKARDHAFPWVLGLHKPGPDVFQGLNPAGLQMLKILQKEAVISRELDAIKAGWRSETLLHGDIKSDNVLVLGKPGQPISIRLVDWEILHVGDPAWDLAGAVQDLLVFWVLSMPLTSQKKAAEMVAEARYPLRVLQGAVRALLGRYQEVAQMTEDAAGFQDRIVRYSAARLIQSAYEHSYNAHQLPNPSVAMLQISANIMANPKAAAQHLLGLPPVPMIVEHAASFA